MKTLPAGENNVSKPTKEEITQKTQKLQMPFIANNSQVDDKVKFYAKTFGGTVFVTKEGEIVYSLPKSEKAGGRIQKTDIRIQKSEERCRIQDNRESDVQQIGLNGLNYLNGLDGFALLNPSFYNSLNSSTPSNSISRSIAFKETIIGAKISGIRGEQPAVTTANYFTGNDKSKWKTNVPTYDFVNLGEIYRGVELKLKAYGNNVEKLFL